jgi:hypothetical protein
MQLAAMPRWLITLSLVALLSSSAEAATARCQVQSIDLREPGSRSSWFAITTDKPANFTSFKLGHPSRVVVDFPETAASFRKAEGPAGGPIAGWSVETIGTDEQSVARLTVELREDADYTLTSNAGTIELRFVPATARPLTAIEHDPAPVVADTPTQVEQEPAAREGETAEQVRALAAEKVSVRKAAKAEQARRVEEKKARRAQAQREARERAAATKARAAADREARLAARREQEEARRAAAGNAAVLERVAFRHSAEGAELVLKLSAPVAHATREEAGRLILDLEHTRITVPNNRRELDTRFFGTAVSRITPREDRSAGRVSIEMELGGAGPYEVKADGSTIAVLFARLQTQDARERSGLTAVP